MNLSRRPLGVGLQRPSCAQPRRIDERAPVGQSPIGPACLQRDLDLSFFPHDLSTLCRSFPKTQPCRFGRNILKSTLEGGTRDPDRGARGRSMAATRCSHGVAELKSGQEPPGASYSGQTSSSSVSSLPGSGKGGGGGGLLPT